jgi:hypothetical protein
MSVPQFEMTLGDLFEQILGDYIDGHLKINNDRMTPTQATEYFAKEAKELGYNNEQVADCAEELLMTLQDTIVSQDS